MAQNNPFHFDIDDDGLPKYSPDRKNITAYHMYKLGMTDSLPDPDVPEPLFRTPSYVKEMEEREREREREMNRLAQLFRPVPSPFSGEDGMTNPVERTPQQTKPADPLKPLEFKPVELKPLVSDIGKDKLPFSSVTPDAAVVRNEPKPAQPGHSAGTVSSSPLAETTNSGQPGNVSPSGPLKEVLDKLTDGYMKLHFGDGFSNPPESGPGIVSDDRMYPAKPVGPVDGVCVPERMPDGSAQTGPFTMNAGQMADRVNGEWIDKGLPENSGENPDAGIWGPSGDLPLRRLLDECLDAMQEGRSDKRLLFFREASQTDGTPGAAIRKIPSADGEAVAENNAFDTGSDLSGWMERETAQADHAGVQQDGNFSVNELEAPSAGRDGQGGLFKSVFPRANSANPEYRPKTVSFVDTRLFRIRAGRWLVTEQMTEDMNKALTIHNQGYPIGINFRFLSVLEGGSGHAATIPLNRDKAQRNEDRQNRSGVTVGAGFDLGQTDVKGLKAYGFPDALIKKLSPYLGKKRLDAFHALDARPLTLTDKELDIINRQVMIQKSRECIYYWDKAIETIRKTHPEAPWFHEMSSNQQTIIFSRYYHEGLGWRKNNQEIYEAATRNDWKKAQQIVDYKVKYNPDSWPEWKMGRLQKEQEFLWSRNKR